MKDNISEGDVEAKLILPIIIELGYSDSFDSKHQVDFNIGRKHDYGFSDFDLFIRDNGGKIYTAIIESKKPNQDWTKARNQARSYATASDRNAPFYAVFDNSNFELLDVRFPNDPVLAGSVSEIYYGSTLMNELKACLSPVAVASYIEQVWGRRVPVSAVLGEIDMVKRQVDELVSEQVPGYIGGQILGRDAMIDSVVQAASSLESGVIAVTGPLGVGKSVVLTEVFRQIDDEAKAIHYFSKSNIFYNRTETFFRFLCAQLFPKIAPEQITEITRASSMQDLFWTTIQGLRDGNGRLNRRITVVVDGLDQVDQEVAQATVGVLAAMAGQCEGLVVIVASQPPLSIESSVPPFELGLLDMPPAADLWDRARAENHPPSGELGNDVPRMPLVMKIMLDSEGQTLQTLIKAAGQEFSDVVGIIWDSFSESQRTALAFICTDPRGITRQDLAELIDVAPSSRVFMRDIEFIRRLLRSTDPFLVPVDKLLRQFVAAQLNNAQKAELWDRMLALRERQTENNGHVDLYPYIAGALGEDQLPAWVQSRLDCGSPEDFNALDSVWEHINLEDYGDEGQLLLAAALKTSLVMARHDRQKDFQKWLEDNHSRRAEFEDQLLGVIDTDRGDQLRSAIQCFINMGKPNEPLLDRLRQLVQNGENSHVRACAARGLVLIGTKDDRPLAIAVVSRLIAGGVIDDIVFSAGSVSGDAALLGGIVDLLENPPTDRPLNFDLVMTMLGAIAESNLDERDVQSAVVDMMGRCEDLGYVRCLALSPYVSGSVDDPGIVDRLLGLMDPECETQIARHLVYLRTSELSLPHPLSHVPEAVRNAPRAVSETARKDIVEDSQNKSAWKDWHHKDWATQFAAYCGLEEIRQWLPLVLRDSSPYVVHWACKYIGALNTAGAVPVLGKLLQEPSHDLVHIGAAEALGAIASRDGGEFLIASPSQIDGNVLVRGSEALAHCATESGSVERLFAVAADKNQPELSRAVCIGAIESLTYVTPDIHEANRSVLWQIIDDPESQDWWGVSCLKSLCAIPVDDGERDKLGACGLELLGRS